MANIMYLVENLVADFDENHEFVGFKGYIFDVTERNLAEKKLIESEQRLINLNATRDKFFSIIAHDMRSPISGLIGLLKLLGTEFENMTLVEIQETVNVLLQSSENLLKLLENLLEWSKLQIGRFQFSPQPVDLYFSTKLAIDLLKNSAAQKSITITHNINEGSFVIADSNMLSALIRNLISNAIKYTHRQGNVTISIIENGDFYEYSVQDNGIGIDPEQIAQIDKIDGNFETRGTDGELGTGFGLVICKEFLDLHNSALKIESSLGNGSTFSFKLKKAIT